MGEDANGEKRTNHHSSSKSHEGRGDEETTKNHVTAVLRGFGVKTRVQAVLAAGERGYTKAAPLP